MVMAVVRINKTGDTETEQLPRKVLLILFCYVAGLGILSVAPSLVIT